METEKGSGGSSCTTEATLYEQAQGGCSESLNELMLGHEGLVRAIVQRQWLYSLSYEEALQAGRAGLWRAILGYDPRRGTTFATYAYPAIMRYVWAVVKAEKRRKKREVGLEILVVYCYRTEPEASWQKEQQEVEEGLRALVKRLPERLREVIQAYYGLEGEERQTLQAIGEEMGVTRERVRQLRNEGLVWLRQPAHSQELRSMLARHNQQQYELADELAQAFLRQRGGRNGRH
jgi:RNA polymerase sigma factor (sigma-70 family)